MLLAGQKVSFVESLGISGISVLIIMAVLALIMCIIYIMSYVLKKTQGITLKQFFDKKKSGTDSPVADETAAAPVYAHGTCGEIKLNDVDERTAAMVMAIVADETGLPLNELRFISIREVKGE